MRGSLKSFITTLFDPGSQAKLETHKHLTDRGDVSNSIDSANPRPAIRLRVSLYHK